MNRWWKFTVALLVLVLAAAACQTDGDGGADDPAPTSVETGGETATDAETEDAGDDGETSGDGLLSEVQSRGTLQCGVNDSVPGFGFVDEEGDYQGFDIDFCRVIAAAVLGDSEAVEFTPLTAEQRFTALQSGEVDVLVRNTTWTATRDGSEGAQFAVTTFYDGQGMMVKSDSDIASLEDLDGATICTLSGTTTELNLESTFQSMGIEYTPLAQEENDPLLEAFIADRCQGYTSDKSQLAGLKSNFPEDQGGPDAVTILEDVTMSKEPLGPAVRQGDSQWYDAVNWAVIATIQAEEFGITSDNVEDMQDSDDPGIQTFLGQPTEEGGTVDPGLGLPTNFAAEVVSQVGNYGEIYERNVGPDTPLGLERGENALWTEGGLLYAPPYR